MSRSPQLAAREPGPDSHMGFVGVTTTTSSIMDVFPRWADELRLPTRTLIGHDVAVGAPPQVYRALVERIRDDPAHLGALVTTHKVNLFAAAHDLFDELDDLALTFEEISSIYTRGDRLCAGAKDPVTARLALEEFVPADHFARTGGEVLCLGDGGAAAALTHELGRRADAPARITMTSVASERLEHVRALHERADLDPQRFSYRPVSGPDDSGELLAALPPGSLVVNATGMGKDLPGSPLPADARFPQRGYVWEFNYRGSLEFLHQARAQEHDRGLVVEDGWRYFVHGWSQVVGDVFDVPMTPSVVERLAAVAAQARAGGGSPSRPQ